MTGDEASARENLREAARLDEEDAEDRYQLRVQRNNSEQRRVGSKERDSVSEVKSHEEDVPQVGRVRSYTWYFMGVGWNFHVWHACTVSP